MHHICPLPFHNGYEPRDLTSATPHPSPPTTTCVRLTMLSGRLRFFNVCKLSAYFTKHITFPMCVSKVSHAESGAHVIKSVT